MIMQFFILCHEARKKVFLFRVQQALRQPVAAFAYKHFYFLRYRQKLQRLSGCSYCRKAVTILAVHLSSSVQPTLSCKKLHSFRLHFIPPPFLSAFCSPPAALFGSPALRPRLRGCHAFCIKKQKSRQPLAASSSHPMPSYFGLLCLPPGAQLATARPHTVCKPLHFISLFASAFPLLAQGCITCFPLQNSTITENSMTNK
jgi:hypothetical protein